MPNPLPIHEHFFRQKKRQVRGGHLRALFLTAFVLKSEENTSLIKSHPHTLKIFDV